MAKAAETPDRGREEAAGRSRVAGRANQSVSPHPADTDGCLAAASEPTPVDTGVLHRVPSAGGLPG